MSVLTATGGPPRHAQHRPLTQGQRLAQDAAVAAEVRTWQTHPDVVALRVEGIRTQVDRLMWTGIVLGLCFTMTNVQQFAATGTPVGSLAWWSAWLLDPMVSLVLLAVLRAEQVTTRYQVNTGPWPRVAKWSLLSATYVMNTWASWAAGSASGVVLHSVPPLVVVIATEAITDLQHALTECVHCAHPAATHRVRAEQAARNDSAASAGTQVHPDPVNTAGELPVNPVAERSASPVGERELRQPANPSTAAGNRAVRPVGGPRRKRRSRAPMRRKFLADYLTEARTAWTTGQVVTPAWVRQVTDCSRGLSSKVAAELNAELSPVHQTTTRTEPEGKAA